jgi:hypothetical protein
MSEILIIPHIRLPRSLLDNDLWINLPLGYREVFLAILDHICFRPQKFDDHGNLIELLIGQVCTTIREITTWLGKFGNKNIVERAIKKFILYDFVRQEVRHSKSIFTIRHRDTYELIKRASETRSETILRQDLDKIETQTKNEKNEKKEKENKSREALEKVVNGNFSNDIEFDKEKLENVISQTETKHNVYTQTTKQEQTETNENNNTKKQTKSKQKIEKIAFRESVLLTQVQHDKLLEEHGKTALEWMLDKLNNQKLSSGKTYQSDYHAILNWVVAAYKQSSNPQSQSQGPPSRAVMNGKVLEEYNKIF